MSSNRFRLTTDYFLLFRPRMVDISRIFLYNYNLVSEKGGFTVKKDIHPNYVECKVSCACGNSFVTRSTVPELKLDICSQCHPFFTGKQKLIDTAGRVDRFKSKYSKTGGKTVQRKPKAVVMKIKPLKKIKQAVPKMPAPRRGADDRRGGEGRKPREQKAKS